jgi:uracil-DNA glycosylase
MPRDFRKARKTRPQSESRAGAAALIPGSPTLQTLQQEAKSCKACDLWKLGTQTVFGEGPAPARVMFVGEQPGDSEDRAGQPFVGPAGRMLDEVLSEVGIDRSEVYVTNVVKHFKWVAAQRGKRRIHKNRGSRKLKPVARGSTRNFRLLSLRFWSALVRARPGPYWENISESREIVKL